MKMSEFNETFNNMKDYVTDLNKQIPDYSKKYSNTPFRRKVYSPLILLYKIPLLIK